MVVEAERGHEAGREGRAQRRLLVVGRGAAPEMGVFQVAREIVGQLAADLRPADMVVVDVDLRTEVDE